jgi:hypothetical protein
MNKFFAAAFFITTLTGVFAQEINQDLKPFSKIIASPRINVVLQKGEHESIRLVYQHVAKGQINIEVHGRTLQIFLDHAKKIEKKDPYHRGHYGNRPSMYDGATITAYVTYKYLEAVEIRGNQELVCNDQIESDEFRLRAYGENEITLAFLKTEFFKASLYGQNQLKIKSGKVIEQKYKLFGENKIDTKDMRSVFATASIFGEGRVNLNTTENLRLDSFGEPTIYVNGGGHVNRRLIFGRTNIHQD